MASRLQLRRGTKTEHESFAGQVGETTVDTTNDDLRVHDGSTVGGKSAAQGNKYDGIKQLDNAPLKDRAQYDVAGFYAGTEVGGGQFIYDASRPKADHNGGTVITPEAILAWDGTQANLSVLLDWTGTGTGAFVLLEKSVPSVFNFGAVDDETLDSSSAVIKAVESCRALDLGSYPNKFGMAQPAYLKGSSYYKCKGAEYVGLLGLEGSEPYTPRGILNATSENNIVIDGLVKTYLDHTIYPYPDTGVPRPTITGFLVNNCKDCDFGKFIGFGSVNYSYIPDFEEYGIVDIRDSENCDVTAEVNGRYTQETIFATPSTLGIAGRNNINCNAVDCVAENTYYSGISWNGTDCKVIRPRVRNTRGSNLNLSGTNTNAYDVDLQKTQQGNISIGEGIGANYSCNVFGGIAGVAQFQNVAFSETTMNCKVFLEVYGWGQEGSTQTANVGFRVLGKRNYVEGVCHADYNGFIANGDACNVLSSNLTTPEAEENEIHIKGYGAGTLVRAPKTVIDVETVDLPSGVGVVMGYRCAGSEIRHVRAENCDRPIAYSPNTGDSADSAGVRVGSIIAVNCTNDMVMPLLENNYTDRITNRIESSETALTTNDILYELEAYTKDTSLLGRKLAAALRLLCTSSSGNKYGVDIATSTETGGDLETALAMFRYGELEIERNGTASSLILTSPNGTRYRLTPPDGGGAASWVTA